MSNQRSPYLSRLGYETDVWLSVATGGAEDETVSLRTAKAAARVWAQGRDYTPACLLCRWLSLTVERDHCARQLAGISTKPLAAFRAALQFALVLGVLWGFSHFALMAL